MLELVQENPGDNAFEYLTCADNWVPFPPGATSGYHGWCGIGTRQYLEKALILDSFVYDHANDVYRFIVWMNQANYPSWKIKAYTFDPETAEMIDSTELVGFAVAHAWTDPMYNGGLNGLYAGYIVSPYKIVNVSLPDGFPSAAQIANPHVTATQIPNLAASNMGFAICPERKLFCMAQITNGIQTYDYSAYPSAATLLYYRPLPESFVWGMGYENEETCWLLCSDTITGAIATRQTLLKYNYGRDKIELVSELQQTGAPDEFAQVAFDTKRKKIAAIRLKADDADGRANNTFQIYSPRPVMAHITVPVNISKLSEDEEATLVTHLMGTKAEAGGNKEITVSCAPTAGLITQPKLLTESSGRAAIKITPSTSGATETITVQYNETKESS
jgi:hypothetical protein